ncbi:hypothetical protein Patl1_17796 [Pistacia atlantica]|uniref:Uncharacterized protein n=1 Tax=Pistacia atlantica TaxID=434234 RepID=A0ACC1BZB1_9ROSI|nr:hypothetical protein Patl1_17796 [Pistacia atlantica]
MDYSIPTVDLSPFFRENDEDGKKKAIEVIREACSTYGFFQIVNHGVPPTLLCRALELSKTFFGYSDEEKLKSSPGSGAPLPAGYSRQPLHSPDKNEYLLMFPPSSTFNVYLENPPEFKEVLEEVFSHLTKTCSLIESIVNECLDLPPNFLKEYNHDRSWDFMAALRYFPATEAENNGITEHEDGNCVTFVFQDQVGGLEVKKNDQWIPVTPAQDTIVVNLGDVIQGEKWVEPLPQFSKDIGEPPKYRGFLYKEYQALRMRNKTHPPTKPEDVIHITHYATTT